MSAAIGTPQKSLGIPKQLLGHKNIAKDDGKASLNVVLERLIISKECQ